MELMDSYPGIKYFIHDGGTYLIPHYASVSNLRIMLDLARTAAYRSMSESGAAHAVYGVKHYDAETGALSKVDIYSPAVLLNDDAFYERTDDQAKGSPGCLILALHAK